MVKSIYEKPIWKLLEEFAVENANTTFTKKDILEWFNKNYSKISKRAVELHIISCSVNNPQRQNYSVKKDILFRLEDGKFKKYDSDNDGFIEKKSEIERYDEMSIDGTINKHKKDWLIKCLNKNAKFLHEVALLNTNSLPILVKYVEKEDFEKIWDKIDKPNDFFNNFKSIVRQLIRNLDENTQGAMWELMEGLSLGEPIVAFVSDIDFKEFRTYAFDLK